jgi:hypothetical protein
VRRFHDRDDQARLEVVDVAGDGDARRDLRGGEQSLDVGPHGLGGIEDRHVGQHLLVVAGSLRKAVAEVLVGEQAASAIAVVDDRRLEVRPVRGLGLDQVADVGDVLDDRRCDPAADGARDDRVGELEWEHADELARRFPAVDVRPEVLYVDEGQILTCAGIAAGIDLCLHMVRNDHGAAAAAEVSRRMVAAVHRPGGQAQFMQRPLPESGPVLAATCAWAIQEMPRSLAVAELAAHAGYYREAFRGTA